jgi:hypothetical protein
MGFATVAVIGLFIYGKATAFEAAPMPSFSAQDSKYLECAIVRHTADHDRDPALQDQCWTED